MKNQFKLVGKTFFDFEFIEFIDEGGQAQFWKCRSLTDGMIVGVKLFARPRDSGTDNTFISESHSQEVSVLTKVPSHRALIRYFQGPNYRAHVSPAGDVYEHPPESSAIDTDEFFFHLIAMELVTPGGLSDVYFNSIVVAAPLRAVQHMEAVVDALAQLHRLGIWHRDIKPSNLLYSGMEDVLKLTDYGLARFQSHGAATFGTGATLEYLAPECFVGSESNDSSRDVYALGVTIHELWTGRHPLLLNGQKPAPEEWQQIHASVPRPSLSESNAKWVTPRLSLVVKEMMDPDPSKRPTLKAVTDALRFQVSDMTPSVEVVRIRTPPFLDADDERVRTKIVPEWRLHPVARQEFLGEFPCMYSLKLLDNYRRAESVEALHGLLLNRLGPSYALMEVVGSRSFVIQAWLRTTDEAAEITRELARISDEVRIAPCLPQTVFSSRASDFTTRGLKESDVQEQVEKLLREDPTSIEARDWLHTNKLLANYPRWKKGVHTWCVAKSPPSIDAKDNSGERRGQWALRGVLNDKILKLPAIGGVEAYFVDRKLQIDLPSVAAITDYDVFISFVAKEYSEASSVSECLRAQTGFIPETIPESTLHTVIYTGFRSASGGRSSETSANVTFDGSESTIREQSLRRNNKPK